MGLTCYSFPTVLARVRQAIVFHNRILSHFSDAGRREAKREP
jgi:hypothetical protein